MALNFAIPLKQVPKLLIRAAKLWIVQKRETKCFTEQLQCFFATAFTSLLVTGTGAPPSTAVLCFNDGGRGFFLTSKIFYIYIELGFNNGGIVTISTMVPKSSDCPAVMQH